jgi:uncharacterized membrane protein YkoI
MTKLICLTILALSAAAATVVAQETKIQLKDLPQAVQKAAQQEQANGATLKGFAKEVEDGKTFYEVETAVKGHTRDLLYDASGQLVEVEEEIASSAVPPAAMKALASHGTVTKVETVTKGKVVAYEAVVKMKSGKSMEVAVDAQGNSVKP